MLAQEIKESYIKSKPGDFIYHVNGKFHIAILKTRIADVNNNKGKSGGWRIIALVDEIQGIIYALSIYMHSNGKDYLTKTEDRLVKKLCDKYYKENY